MAVCQERQKLYLAHIIHEESTVSVYLTPPQGLALGTRFRRVSTRPHPDSFSKPLICRNLHTLVTKLHE